MMTVAEPGADPAFYPQRDTNPFRQRDPRKACDFYFEGGGYAAPDSATSAASSLYQSAADSSDFSDSYCSVADGYRAQGPEIMPGGQDAQVAERPSGPPRRPMASKLPPRPSAGSTRSVSWRQELATTSDTGGHSPQLAHYSATSVQSAPSAPGLRAGNVSRSDVYGGTPVGDFQAWRFSQYGATGRKNRRGKKESVWKKLMFRPGKAGASGSSPAETLEPGEQHARKLPTTDGGGYVGALPEHLAMMSASSLQAQKYAQKHAGSPRAGKKGVREQLGGSPMGAAGSELSKVRTEYYDPEALIEGSPTADAGQGDELERHFDEFMKASTESFAPIEHRVAQHPAFNSGKKAVSPRSAHSVSPEVSGSPVPVSTTTWDPMHSASPHSIHDLMNTTPDHLMFAAFLPQDSPRETAPPEELMASTPQDIDFFQKVGPEVDKKRDQGQVAPVRSKEPPLPLSIVINIEVHESNGELSPGRGPEEAPGMSPMGGVDTPRARTPIDFSESESSMGSPAPCGPAPISTGLSHPPLLKAQQTGQAERNGPAPAPVNADAGQNRRTLAKPKHMDVASSDRIAFSFDSEYSQDIDAHVLSSATFRDRELFGQAPTEASTGGQDESGSGSGTDRSPEASRKAGSSASADNGKDYVNVPSLFTTAKMRYGNDGVSDGSDSQSFDDDERQSDRGAVWESHEATSRHLREFDNQHLSEQGDGHEAHFDERHETEFDHQPQFPRRSHHVSNYSDQRVSNYDDQHTSDLRTHGGSNFGRHRAPDYDDRDISDFGSQRTHGHTDRQGSEFGGQHVSGHGSQRGAGVGHQWASPFSDERPSAYSARRESAFNHWREPDFEYCRESEFDDSQDAEGNGGQMLEPMAALPRAGHPHDRRLGAGLDSYGQDSDWRPVRKPHLSQKSRRFQALSRSQQWQELTRTQSGAARLEGSELCESRDEYQGGYESNAYEGDTGDYRIQNHNSDASEQSMATTYQGLGELEEPRLKLDPNFVPRLPVYSEGRVWTLSEVKRLSGTWMKDVRASDHPAAMCEFLELGWIFQKAILNSRQLQVDVSEAGVRMKGKLFGLIEQTVHLAWDPCGCLVPRRDLRTGFTRVWLERIPGGFRQWCQWEDPAAGGKVEDFHLTPDGRTLRVHAHLVRLTGQELNTMTVYKRM